MEEEARTLSNLTASLRNQGVQGNFKVMEEDRDPLDLKEDGVGPAEKEQVKKKNAEVKIKVEVVEKAESCKVEAMDEVDIVEQVERMDPNTKLIKVTDAVSIHNECGICGKRFYRREDFLNHTTNLHKIPRPFQCKVCKKSFTQKHYVALHMLVHTGERPYKCQYCGKCFRQWYKRRIHISLHTGERPCKCDVCGKGFRRNDDVKRHMRSHQGIKSFKCFICDTYCATQASINGHIDLHHAELRQIDANAPEKTVVKDSNSDILGTIHISYHTGEWSCKCDVCGKGFCRNDRLKRHMSSHQGIKSFKCLICDTYCATQASITGHIDLHHAEPRQIDANAPEKTVVKDSNSDILGTKTRPQTIYKPIEVTQASSTQTAVPVLQNKVITKVVKSNKNTDNSSDTKIQTINGEKTQVLSYKEFIELQEKLLLCKGLGLTVKNPKGNSNTNNAAEGSTDTKDTNFQPKIKVGTDVNRSLGKQIMFIAPQGGQKGEGMRLVMPQSVASNKQVIVSSGAATSNQAQRFVIQQPSMILPQNQLAGGQQIFLLSKPGGQQSPKVLSKPLLLLSGTGNNQHMVLLPSKPATSGSNVAGGFQTLLLPSTSLSTGGRGGPTVLASTTTSGGVVVKQEPGQSPPPPPPALAPKSIVVAKEESGIKLTNGVVIKQEPPDEDTSTFATTSMGTIHIKQELQD